MKFIDKLTPEKVRQTKDGYIAANVRVARTGIQIYRGDQLGKPEMSQVRVYRPPEEVFNEDAIRSYAHRPVTVGHPDEPVTPTNWKNHSVGQTGDEVVRDGQTVRVSMLVMDEAAIQAVNGGIRELSMGYSADIDWTDGETPDGEPYDAIQRNHRMNHLAIVATARGGSKLRIGDDKRGGPNVTDKTTQIVHDGLPVNVPEAVAPIINKWLADAKAETEAADMKAKKSEEELADMKKKKETVEGENAALTKQIEDAKLTPEAIDKMVADRAALVAEATSFLDKAPKGTDAEIRKAVVAEVLGEEAVEGMSDDAIKGAYSVAIKSKDSADPVTKIIKDGGDKTVIKDAEQARQAMLDAQRDAWKSKGAV